MTYRLNIDIGGTSTSASYHRAEESGVLRLSRFARDLPSTQFVADSTVAVASLAETLRSIITIANQQLGEAPTSVEVTYPASGIPANSFCYGRHWFLPGFLMR